MRRYSGWLAAVLTACMQDIRAMNDHAMKAAPRKTGAILLGGGAFLTYVGQLRLVLAWATALAAQLALQRQPGLHLPLADPVWHLLPALHSTGVPKHHICNANLMKNGLDFAVFLNTAQEFDGSDSGEPWAERRQQWTAGEAALAWPGAEEEAAAWASGWLVAAGSLLTGACYNSLIVCRRAARRGGVLGQDPVRRQASQGAAKPASAAVAA